MTRRRFAAALATLLFVLTVALRPAGAKSQFTPFEAAIARFDAETAAGVADDAAGFVSVAVFEGDRVLWSKGYGWADIERRVAASERTIGRVGSISKTFTALVVVQLAEAGVLELDEAVSGKFPPILNLADPPAGMRPITWRMLASHTAGLVREPAMEGAASGPIYGWEEKVLASIPHTGFKTPPLTEYSYSNIGFVILGLAASRAAGVDFMELVRRQIIEPLALDSTVFVVNRPDLARRLAVGYSRSRRTGEVSAARATREHLGRGYKVPNGGIYSTVGDLARFAAGLMGRSEVEILPEAARREMLTPQAPATGYGLGLALRDTEVGRVAGHGGSVAGYNADLAFHLESGLGVAMLRTTRFNPATRELLAAAR